MKLRIINPTIHGLIDYSAAVGLITVPFLLGLGNSSFVAVWLSVTTGITVILASMMTDYKLGMFKVIPFDGHLALDLTVATIFMAIPVIFDLTGICLLYTSPSPRD